MAWFFSFRVPGAVMICAAFVGLLVTLIDGRDVLRDGRLEVFLDRWIAARLIEAGWDPVRVRRLVVRRRYAVAGGLVMWLGQFTTGTRMS